MQDAFEDGDYTASPEWTVSSGNWRIAADPADSGNKALNQTDTGEGIITAGDPAWTDFTVTMRFFTEDGGNYPGILARVQDARNFYYFQMQAANTLVLSKRINGIDTTIRSLPYAMNKNTWYQLKMVLIGNSIKCYIVNNGTDRLVFEAIDDTFTSGKVGIRNKWQSVHVDDVTVAGVPAANPSTLRSDAQTGSAISLSWDPVEGAASYNIYRSTASGSGYAFVANSASTSFTDTGLSSDTSYYYRIAFLYGGLTESQWSAELSARTDAAPPAAPMGLTAVAVNSSTVRLTWSAADKATGYRVYRAPASSDVFGKVYEGTALSFLDTGLTPDTAYKYQITAYNATGESEASSVQATTFQYDAPRNFKAAEKTDTSVTLSWDAIAGENVIYRISRAASSAGAYTQIYTGTDTEYTDIGLTEGTGYFYRIGAVIDGVASAVSEPLGVGTMRTAITPDTIWADTSGNPIDAHGAGILYDENTQKYYWYGEYHQGAWPSAGVRVYSSTDLLNWTDEGMALTLINSMDDFANDPLISELYAGRADTLSIWADIRKGRIVERPKVIYNDQTKKYVMWAHIDGDKDPYNDNANYGKAQAGYAISDSPTGPFVYQKSYRMDECPPDQTDYQPGNPGMARDMNLFKDDDGTAYLIYSSEENRTIYISKLLDDYSDVVGWHKDGNVDENGNPVRDAAYKGVYGEDYIRVFPGGVREAPAVFKYDGKYYLLTSGATGWSPNENMYSVSDSMLGNWSPLKDPFVRISASDPNPMAAFNSQTASVIPVDPANGKFIYVGDDWNGGNFSANGGAKYVWLPIEFSQGTDISIKWYSRWTLDLLDQMKGIEANVQLPEVIAAGTELALPSQIEVSPKGSTETSPTNVLWTVNGNPVTANTFALPGTYTLQATLPQLANKTLQFKISAVADKTIYFVNSGGSRTPDYSLMTSYLQDTLLNKDVVEQLYNPADSTPWGYVQTSSNPSGSDSGDIFSTLRYLNGGNVTNSPAGTDLTYKFTVPNGTYIVYTGFNDIWNNSSRKADLYINDVKKTAITYISNKVYRYPVDVTDGMITIMVRNTAAQDPLINWIMIADDSQTPNPAMGLTAVPASADSAAVSWNKTLGAIAYKLFRSTSAEGPYAPVYEGSQPSFTDSGLEPVVSYYYKVGSYGLSGEIAMSSPVLMDRTPPEFNLLVDGRILADGDSFDDHLPLTFQASDALSGLASARVSVSGSVYSLDLANETASLTIDWAGKIGSYTATIEAEDMAGNKLQATYHFNVTTSLAALNELLDRYEDQLSHPLFVQLDNSLKQAQHQLDIDRPDHAADHMQDFLKHLNNPALGDIDPAVKDILNTDANVLILEWSNN
ncbi:fibronectin type III domain-containing protein [Cohnella lubricantis]|uniref:Fibronectin type III domain-containing protein n=2 Tax=Cohnella lubricantis TaxID=2163172 RepID=A0A841TCZ1_9BACL|nr:fibronectin type III domain-containing protein [Cohnella lubricantis]